MDRLKNAVKATRNTIVPHQRSSDSSTSLVAPQHEHARPRETASTASIKSGVVGPRPVTSTEDFARAAPQSKPLPPRPAHIIARKALPSRPSPEPSQTPPAAIPDRQSSLHKSPRQQPPPPPRPVVGSRLSSIGIRRVPSQQAVGQSDGKHTTSAAAGAPHLPTLAEDAAFERRPSEESIEDVKSTTEPASRWARARLSIRQKLGLEKESEPAKEKDVAAEESNEYESSMVDLLDTVDPEVATLSTLTNVQNSLFIPDLGKYINRRPIYNLINRRSDRTSDMEMEPSITDDLPTPRRTGAPPSLRRLQSDNQSMFTIDSTLSESRYAVLPHGTDLSGWSQEDKKELNDHVRHMMHSRKSRFKRSMRGFGQYVRRPLGFLVTLYATLITLFGLAWVLFLIGWVNVGGKQLYMINVIDYVLVALFAIVGDGLAPFRAVDTYHMVFIAYYHRLTWKLRDHQMLPPLDDHNDLPTEQPSHDMDVEKQPEKFTVLTEKQQEKLTYHQEKFAKSHTFFKPHETETHHAFPMRLLIAVVVLLDFHSLFQISLGACTWSINYHKRPFALTTVILCCSITCNATAGILIMVGDRRTRKKDVLERMNRQELTGEAIELIESRWEREREREEDQKMESPSPPANALLTKTRRFY